ncbi:CRISPR-associated helicase, Cas3 family [Caminicella sporogenes DSM 14501]|uniref:CRISPR-associated helicase, Cas3 family n=1 Tax=Caminicella sporogenes DSM 14501 TaxID=1121266 RepID=A0A1M6TP22_9FIRM|nr:CRISPR-associated helicase Cas3' [Caminicella sporogenes]RKD24804.1 CRISPR-associated helicase/endonuclease Cas3 [Caminicella sporogenes]SHK58687.1 CRISPR-associated helicase, Cas3 family [Caminicella sporogenes DSM 14501]
MRELKNLFLAKTNPRETIIEHTEALLDRLKHIKEIYPNIKYIDWEILKLACIYHDIGKINTKFQNKLYEKLNEQKLEDNIKGEKEIPHGYLSPAFLPKKFLERNYDIELIRVLYQSIYYHHNREKLENFDLIKLTVKEDLNRYWNEFKYDKVDKSEKLYSSYGKYVKKRIESSDCIYKKYVMTKGLLNKLDYAASAHIDVEIENKDLFEKTTEYLQCEGYVPNELQDYMMKNQEKNNIIIASTGIGKTEASLFWIGNNKGFFTLPLRVSINAIYDRIKEKIKFEDIALLHSETYSEYLKRNELLDTDFYDKTRQLSMPLTVCTLDQLIDFIFKSEGYELKLATLSYSKLVIDEIQMYSPEMIGYLIMALKYITELGGKFSIVTATMPPVIIDLMKKEEIKFNNPVTYYKKVNNKIQLRHRVSVVDEQINIKHVKDNYKNKKILIICNTVKKAQQIYSELIDEFKDEHININLLHSRFVKKDRAKKEDDILRLGNKNCKETGIWVTTQIVEASLDIDFDVLYTELSDISGLFQRMGRVYRNRTLEDKNTNIYVYLGGDKPTSGVSSSQHSIIDIEIFNLSKEAIKDFKNKELNEKEKMRLVEMTYTKEKLKNSNYYKVIKDTIDWVKRIKEYELEKNEMRLRNIINFPVIPKIIYDKNKKLIQNSIQKIKNIREQMRLDKSNVKELRKEIQKSKDDIKSFVVDIPLYEFEYARKNALIYDEIELDRFNRITIIAYDYSFEKGLTRPKCESNFNEKVQFL